IFSASGMFFLQCLRILYLFELMFYYQLQRSNSYRDSDLLFCLWMFWLIVISIATSVPSDNVLCPVRQANPFSELVLVQIHKVAFFLQLPLFHGHNLQTNTQRECLFHLIQKQDPVRINSL